MNNMENFFQEGFSGLRKYWPFIFGIGMLIGACVAHTKALYEK
jgi:hypothetical protein